MVKRILSVVLCVLAVVLCCFPASAAGNGQNDIRYASVPFDFIRGGPSYKAFVEYAGRAGTLGYSANVSDSNLGTQYVSVSTDSNNVDTITNRITLQPLYRSYNIRLSAEDFVVDFDLLDTFDIYQGYTDHSAGVFVTVTGSVYTYERGYNEWVLTEHAFSKSGTNAVQDVASLLRTAVREFTSSRYVFFQHLYVDIQVLQPGSFDGYLWIVQSSREFPARFRNWEYQYDLLVAIDEPGAGGASFVDWLVDSVGAIMSFELIPGLSFDRILELIIIFALVFWFITLLI